MKRWWLAVWVPFLVVACGDESPTGVGAGLLPPDVIQTVEIVLGPEQYLVFDTAFGLYSDPRDMDFLVVANQLDGGMSANSLVRFNIPTALSVIDTLGVGRLDSVPTWIGGTLRMQFDTAFATGYPIRLAVYRTAEDWDGSATWQLRRDTGSVQQPWATPGGTRGPLVATTTIMAVRDTVEIPVDSATLALWADTANAARGAVVVMESQDGRIRTTLPVLELRGRSSYRPDTVYTATASAPTHTFVYTPAQPEVGSQPRVGGTPAWRTVMRLRERLDTLSFACPGVPNCRYRLSEANLSYAGLRLQPTPAPPGFHPEGPLTIVAYLLLPSPQLPLQRSPLSEVIGVSTVQGSSFRSPDAPVIEVPLTELIRIVTLPPADRPTDFPGTHFALVPGDRTFGFGTFAALPSLRLVVSVTRELQLP